MKIAVILGSPCGGASVTLQYVEFVRHCLPQHTLELVDVGRGVRRMERDEEHFAGVLATLAAADAIIWAFPVYTFLTPAAMVRFVELLFHRGAATVLEGKVATVLTSSEHFFDHTAHAYMEAVSEDLGMRVFHGFSAAMEELFDAAGRHNLEAWVRAFVRVVADDAPLARTTLPVSWTPPVYRPLLGDPREKTGSLRITLITDLQEGDDNLANMIAAFCHHVAHPVDVLNLRDIGMKGSCLGCLRCIHDGTCVYEDGFAAAFDGRIRTADVLVFAGTLRHRYLGPVFKTYFDRNFRNGHRPILHGKPMGWLLSGPLRQMPNMRRILEGKNEVQHSPRLGVVTDEVGDEKAITAHIAELASAVDRWSVDPWIRPATFLGVGGRKIFRDLMYTMRGLVRADHLYYRREGLYDFPQQDHRRTLFNWMMAAMMTLPWTRRWLMGNMGKLKVIKLRKLVEQKAAGKGP